MTSTIADLAVVIVDGRFIRSRASESYPTLGCGGHLHSIEERSFEVDIVPPVLG